MFLSWSSIETETGEKKSMGAGTRRSEEVGFVCLWKVVCSVCLVRIFRVVAETNLCEDSETPWTLHFFFFFLSYCVHKNLIDM